MVRLGTPRWAVVPPQHHRSPSKQVGLLGACCHRPRAYSLDVTPGREWTRAPRCFKAHVSLNCPLSKPSGHVACVCARSPRRDHNAPPQRSFERHEQQRELSASSAPYEFREVLDQICSLTGKPAPRCSRARTAHGPAPPTGLSSMSNRTQDIFVNTKKKLSWYYVRQCQHSFTTLEVARHQVLEPLPLTRILGPFSPVFLTHLLSS